MLSKEDLTVIAKTPLFAVLSDSERKDLADKETLPIKEFSSGETIYSSDHFSHSLGILLTGKAQVKKTRDQGSPLTMAILAAGDIFGMAAVFFPTETYVREIKAINECRIVFFSQEVMERLFQTKPDLALSYIRLLSQRIHFLNGKIDAFTGHDSRSRLVAFLWENMDAEKGEVLLPYSVKSLGERLGIARASLYRAFDALETDGLIKREGKRILIPNLQLLRK